MTARQRRIVLGEDQQLISIHDGARYPDTFSVERFAKGFIVRIESGVEDSGYFELSDDEALALIRVIAAALGK